MSDERKCAPNASQLPQIAAPDLQYLPQTPFIYGPGIALVGCGQVAPLHLAAYKDAEFDVSMLCDLDESRAKAMQQKFFPDAEVSTDYRKAFDRDDIEVVDVATRVGDRIAIIDAALDAGKHVLSQEPLVTDFEEGERLIAKAEELGLYLAVNKSARWAPHFSYIRQVIDGGLIGDVISAHCSTHWDHNWIAKEYQNDLAHPVLRDFAMHWFDIVTCFMGGRKPLRVFASEARSAKQKAKAPLLGQVIIEYEDAQASLAFDGDTRFGAEDRTYVAGSKGAATSVGPDINTQSVTIFTTEGFAFPELEGDWFANGYLGAMCELLTAIEDEREPVNSARQALNGLALCFAALASAETNEPKTPGEVRREPGA